MEAARQLSIQGAKAPTADVRGTPIYFGPDDRSLFGMLHRPSEPRMHAPKVVLCGPLGYEGQFAYISLRELAIRLAEELGAVVLRFDLDGTGDSAGEDDDPARVASWTRSVHEALDEIQRLTAEPGPVALIGLRAGALFASLAASERNDVIGLALWAACQSGRSFIREQRAFSQITAAIPAEHKHRAEWGELGFEANGYVFTDQTVRDLDAIKLANLERAPAPDIFVLNRTEMPIRKLVPEGWRQEGVCIVEDETAGYAAMMEPPWLSTIPDDALTKLVRWVAGLDFRRRTLRFMYSPPRHRARISRSAFESTLRFGAEGVGFGVLTEPAEATRNFAVLLVTSTFGYRIGPNRMNVATARRLAELGVATLRIDLSETGDSRGPTLDRPRAPYDPAATEHVVAAAQALQHRGYQRVAFGGICAGSTMAWWSAQHFEHPAHVLLVNTEAFFNIEYGLREHQLLQTPRGSWMVELRKQRNPLRKLAILSRRATRVAEVLVQFLMGQLPPSLLPTSLHGQMQRLIRRGARLSVIYSSDDDGIGEFRRRLGRSLKKFIRRGEMTLTFIAGPDHSFTSRWARTALVEALATEVVSRSSEPN